MEQIKFPKVSTTISYQDDVPIKAAHRPHCLSQDNRHNVVVAVVGGVGLDFSIFLGSPGLAKVGLVQDTCKYEMYSGVAIFHHFPAFTTLWAFGQLFVPIAF